VQATGLPAAGLGGAAAESLREHAGNWQSSDGALNGNGCCSNISPHRLGGRANG
jgi:hypothetical protein